MPTMTLGVANDSTSFVPLKGRTLFVRCVMLTYIHPVERGASWPHTCRIRAKDIRCLTSSCTCPRYLTGTWLAHRVINLCKIGVDGRSHEPQESNANGVNSHPSVRHGESYLSCFSFSFLLRKALAFSVVKGISDFCAGCEIVISTAKSRLLDQHGSRMSAGRNCDWSDKVVLCRDNGTSRWCGILAAWRASRRMFWTALCRLEKLL